MSKRSKKQAGEDTKGKDELIALKKLYKYPHVEIL